MSMEHFHDRLAAGLGLNLGILFNSRGNHEKSVELLEQHFDLARLALRKRDLHNDGPCKSGQVFFYKDLQQVCFCFNARTIQSV